MGESCEQEKTFLPPTPSHTHTLTHPHPHTSGDNALILYSIDPSTDDGSFEIESGGALSTTRALDREIIPQYNLIIHVSVHVPTKLSS